jgi:hypothetical protein
MSVSILFHYYIFNLFNKIECTTEQQLIRKLLQFYEPSVRPVISAQAVITISFRMEITQLFELVKFNFIGFFLLLL